MSAPVFREWPKISRFFRDVVVSEKLDGTNAAIVLQPGHPSDHQDGWCGIAQLPDGRYLKVGAQSRSRIITPEQDNHGFARWVAANADFLGTFLGVDFNWESGEPAYHFGEWWGLGIQRNYAQPMKRFSLFNTERWASLDGAHALTVGTGDLATTAILGVVPVLYTGPMDTSEIRSALCELNDFGSVAAPGFMNPEGICIYHTASRQVQKVTLDKNDRGKWEA